MIKSLFDYDEPQENKAETEESIKRELENLNLAAETPGADDEATTQIRQTETDLTSVDADDEIETITLPKIEQVYDRAGEPTPDNVFPENQFSEVETQAQAPETAALQSENAMLPETGRPPQFAAAAQYRNVLETENAPTNAGIFQTENSSETDAKPLTTAETLRQSGMAWSAAVGLFGSVLFMMILGWFFDLLTDAAPLGLVGGIIIGSAIGFYQFFRTTSQIFKKD
jgi:F0F1-type ATP synthase assembly protein I